MNTDIENKIRKLLSLAGNNPNQAEASAALAKAQSLMTEYQIEALSLDSKAVDENEVMIEWGKEEGFSGAGWKIDLGHMLAKENGCFTYTVRRYINRETREKETKLGIAGKPSNMRATLQIYAYCVDQIEKLADREAKGLGRAYVTSFKYGCVNAIRNAIQLQRVALEKRLRDEAAASNDCTALVRIDNAIAKVNGNHSLAKKHAYSKMKFRKANTSRSIGSGGGYAHGTRSGSGIYGSSTKRLG